MENNSIKTVEVNGVQIPNFVPENTTPSAIVSLNVIQRLASLLPNANLREIKSEIIDAVEKTQTVSDYIVVLQEEVDFHRTINLISMYNQQQIIPVIDTKY